MKFGNIYDLLHTQYNKKCQELKRNLTQNQRDLIRRVEITAHALIVYLIGCIVFLRR